MVYCRDNLMRHIRQALTFVAFAFVFAGCATMKPSSFENDTPIFEPERFFAGLTHSTGVMESRGGTPTRRITTQTQGVIKNSSLHIEQDLSQEGKKGTHRSWQMRRIDAHHINATANDIIGTAHGMVYGNTFHWSFHLALSHNNPIMRVRMTQWMYLQPGGQTLIIRTVIRKAGIIVLQITEEFSKD